MNDNDKAYDVYQTWISLMSDILKYGTMGRPRRLQTKELIGNQIHIDVPYSNIIVDPQRKINYRLMVANWLTSLIGINDDVLRNYSSTVIKYETDKSGNTFPSWGPMLKPQWPYILKALSEDLETRRAVMILGKVEPLSETDTIKFALPCATSLQFLARAISPDHHLLHTIIYMRASDVWLGLPYDIYNFSMLANFLVASLNRVYHGHIRLGSITVNFGSSHLYEEHWKSAESIVNAPMGEALKSPQIPSWVDTPFGVFNSTIIGWTPYQLILNAKNNIEALEILKAMEPR